MRIASPTVGAHLCRSIVLKVSTKVYKKSSKVKVESAKVVLRKAYFSILNLVREKKFGGRKSCNLIAILESESEIDTKPYTVWGVIQLNLLGLLLVASVLVVVLLVLGYSGRKKIVLIWVKANS